MNAVSQMILGIVGALVLVSYYVVFGHLYRSRGTSYATHDFWFGIDETFVKILIAFQIAAVVGFLVAITMWFVQPPEGGIMGRPSILFLTLLVFLLASICWPFATYYKSPVLVVGSLLLAAIASILLLAGSVQEDKTRVPVMLGLLFFSIVTVLADGVLWNANYIYRIIHDKTTTQ